MTFDPAGYLRTTAEGQHLWFLDTLMSVKVGGAQTAGALTVLEWTAPLGFAPPRHLHQADDEVFYLLDGEITV
jgi:uncharacterized cupin superfamily protein